LPARRVPLAAGARRGLLLALGWLGSATAAALLHQQPSAVAGGLAGALGDALLVVEPLDGGAGALPVRSLPCLRRDGAEGPLGVADPVDTAVLTDLGGGLPPRPLAPGGLGHRAEGVAEVCRPVLVDRLARQAAGAVLPRQRPHHLPVAASQWRVLLQPAGAALLVGAQLLLVAAGTVGLLGGNRLGAGGHARPLLAPPGAAKHAGRLLAPGGGKLGLGLHPPLGGAVQLPAAVLRGLGELAGEPVALGTQLGGRQPLPGAGLPPGRGRGRADWRPGRRGAMVAFVVGGGDERAARFLRPLSVVREATSLGGVETLVSAPHNSSQFSYSREELELAGIGPGLVRLSVGIEDPAELLADLGQALRRTAPSATGTET
jgi:Cys/Met metabolism PLP-dependent enzyme